MGGERRSPFVKVGSGVPASRVGVKVIAAYTVSRGLSIGDDPTARETTNIKTALVRRMRDDARRLTLNLLVRILVMIGSSASIGLGVWHFFVPAVWKWYSYIDPGATELVVAVRAVNAFFSLSLVLFGVANILLVYGDRSNRYSIVVMLAATCVLWVTRVVFQLVCPQGSVSPLLQYGMLSAFVVVSLCYIISLCIVALQRTIA